MVWKKNISTESCWILAPFLSEAVEASLCYWLIKLKCPSLRNTLIPSLQSKSYFPIVPEVFKVYQNRSKDPVYITKIQAISWMIGAIEYSIKCFLCCSKKIIGKDVFSVSVLFHSLVAWHFELNNFLTNHNTWVLWFVKKFLSSKCTLLNPETKKLNRFIS